MEQEHIMLIVFLFFVFSATITIWTPSSFTSYQPLGPGQVLWTYYTGSVIISPGGIRTRALWPASRGCSPFNVDCILEMKKSSFGIFFKYNSLRHAKFKAKKINIKYAACTAICLKSNCIKSLFC